MKAYLQTSSRMYNDEYPFSTHKHRYAHTHTHTDTQTDTLTHTGSDRQAGRQADRQTDGRTDRPGDSDHGEAAVVELLQLHGALVLVRAL